MKSKYISTQMLITFLASDQVNSLISVSQQTNDFKGAAKGLQVYTGLRRRRRMSSRFPSPQNLFTSTF